MNEYVRHAVSRLRAGYVTRGILVAMSAASAVGCRSSELLSVPTPPNVVGQGSLGDSTGAEGVRGGAIGEFDSAIDGYPGIIAWTAMLSDELRIGYNYAKADIGVDARALVTAPDGHTAFDGTYTATQAARILSLQAIAALEQHPSAQAPTEIGELFARAAYAEIFLGETVCPGDPLSTLDPSGGVVYGLPLPTDSVFARALAHFDSAAAHGAGDATVAALVAVGRGRALLDMGRFADAGAAVASVAPTFLYATQLVSTGGRRSRSLYRAWGGGSNQFYTVADGKGGNGLNFVSAHDPRLVTLLTGTTYIGLPAYYPAKFPQNTAANDSVPLADGVEAQLITAEAALAAGNAPAWLAALNQLRANFVSLRGPYPADTSYHTLGPLADPGTDDARVSLTFRERAFWLYGTGHRLGDLRRLIRQYGRDQSTVFPTGTYDNGSAVALFPSYGTSVNFPIGAIESSNLNFHGCSDTQA